MGSYDWKGLKFIVEMNAYQGLCALVSISLKSPAQLHCLMDDKLIQKHTEYREKSGVSHNVQI